MTVFDPPRLLLFFKQLSASHISNELGLLFRMSQPLRSRDSAGRFRFPFRTCEVSGGQVPASGTREREGPAASGLARGATRASSTGLDRKTRPADARKEVESPAVAGSGTTRRRDPAGNGARVRLQGRECDGSSLRKRHRGRQGTHRRGRKGQKLISPAGPTHYTSLGRPADDDEVKGRCRPPSLSRGPALDSREEN